MMRVLLGASMVALSLGVAAAREDKAGGGDSDATFVLKASGSGLAEGNLGRIAVKRAASADVRRFAQKMIDDHTKANTELLALADKARLRPAPAMDAAHERMATSLGKLSGGDFDREYMDGQVKDHEEAVALFEKESKEGKNEDLKGWAGKTLPHLREHLKMAREVQGKLKEGKGSKVSDKE